MMTRSWLRWMLLCVVACWVCFSHVARAGNALYTLAIVPQYSAGDTSRRWAPLLGQIQRETGISLQLRLSKSIDDFEKEVASGLPDLIYLNPYHMVVAHKAHGYAPILSSSKTLRGILVVKRDSPIRSLAELQGKTLAFPSPQAFAASRYLRSLLTHKHNLRYTPVYVGNHQNVYRHVLLDQATAGGGATQSLVREPDAVQSRLRVIYQTPDLPAHPLAAHPRVPAQVREALVKYMIHLNTLDQGRQLLEMVDLASPRRPLYDQDFAPLENLDLDTNTALGPVK